MIQVTSKNIAKIPYIKTFLGFNVSLKTTHDVKYLAGWGAKKSGLRAKKIASIKQLPSLQLEDGFLRSYGTGDHFPPLSLVVDHEGIYYDSYQISTLENLLNSDESFLDNLSSDVAQAKALILENQLSKYNHSADLIHTKVYPALNVNQQSKKSGLARIERVLVIDQTFGDMSVALGQADAAAFNAMLAAAYSENPEAIIYVKTHPEVTSGRKGGYLTHIQDDDRTVVLREAINPISLIEQMDKVYVVSSTMGFEALLVGKPVSVFGMPWYAGWGVTDDRQHCPRRTRKRTIDELFAVAYLHYTRYLNPNTHQIGSIFDVIHWLIHQKKMTAKYSGRMIAVGFRRWKAANIKPLLSLHQNNVKFVSSAQDAETLNPNSHDFLVFWGCTASKDLQALANKSGAKLLRVEDGFVRSVGLGSDLIRPLSLVLDQTGIYFDPTQPSDLEHILNHDQFTQDTLTQAERVRNLIVKHGITKYNVEPRAKANWDTQGKKVVLVPGQVEDDASIIYGCTDVKTNFGLLQAARQAEPDAFIVYKPHPDVMSGNRAGKLALDEAGKFADYVETHLSVVSCIEACDSVHTMTSLTGFDALLRGRRVVVYGQPFYAGWGLTDDVLKSGVALSRRQRKLTLDELVAGTLLRYPIYWDWDLKGYTSCEAVLNRIVEERTLLESNGGLEKLRLGYIRRQWRKIGILFKTWLKRS